MRPWPARGAGGRHASEAGGPLERRNGMATVRAGGGAPAPVNKAGPRNEDHRRRGRHRARRPVSGDETANAASTWKASGNFPAASASPARTGRRASHGSFAKSWRWTRASGDELLATRHDYPDRSVELHFLRCELLGDPVPQMGQEMRWVARAELAAARIPARRRRANPPPDGRTVARSRPRGRRRSTPRPGGQKIPMKIRERDRPLQRRRHRAARDLADLALVHPNGRP